MKLAARAYRTLGHFKDLDRRCGLGTMEGVKPATDLIFLQQPVRGG